MADLACAHGRRADAQCLATDRGKRGQGFAILGPAGCADLQERRTGLLLEDREGLDFPHLSSLIFFFSLHVLLHSIHDFNSVFTSI